jgi:hypothetical protein
MGFGYADAQVADAVAPGGANFLSCEGPTLATYVANDVDAGFAETITCNSKVEVQGTVGGGGCGSLALP